MQECPTQTATQEPLGAWQVKVSRYVNGTGCGTLTQVRDAKLSFTDFVGVSCVCVGVRVCVCLYGTSDSLIWLSFDGGWHDAAISALANASGITTKEMMWQIVHCCVYFGE